MIERVHLTVLRADEEIRAPIAIQIRRARRRIMIPERESIAGFLQTERNGIGKTRIRPGSDVPK